MSLYVSKQGMEMNPLWINVTAGMMAGSLETFYGAILNNTFASIHLTEVLLYYTSMLSNLSVSELTNQADWNAQLFQMQLYQRYECTGVIFTGTYILTVIHDLSHIK